METIKSKQEPQEKKYKYDEKGRPLIKYQASSPDEAALVVAAKNMGYYFHQRNIDGVVVEINGEDKQWNVLNVNEFNSDRKRMSVVVKDPEGRLFIYVKGADIKIKERLRKSEDKKLLDTTWKHLEDYAADGLRTLLLAQRELPQDEYDAWAKKYHEANIATSGRDKKLEAVAEEIEINLELVGATAIEDKLQEGVPNAIYNLAKAGIKIWVLTGDKQETAINIGYACSLLNDDMKPLIVSQCKDIETTRTQLQKAFTAATSKEFKEYALVIDGEALDFALLDQLKMTLLEIGKLCKAVICCRVSPIQKADVVRLVKKNSNKVCLAIGDGANDVSMILQAQIGVGISGQEGMQAVMASDYAIAQFKYLQYLLLVHGRLSYKRVSLLILYSLYKNMTFVLAQFWFIFFAGFSPQSIYDSWYITFYNVFFTSLPIIFSTVLNQDVSPSTLIKYPQLYETGQQNHDFTVKRGVIFLANGVYQSLAIFFIMYGIYSYGGTLNSGGRDFGLWELGHMVYTGVIFTVTLKEALETDYFHWTNHFVTWGSLVVYILFSIIYNAIALSVQPEQYWIVFDLYACGQYYFGLALAIVVALLPEIVFKYLQRTYHPNNADIIREIQLYELKKPETLTKEEKEEATKVSRQVRRVPTALRMAGEGKPEEIQLTGYAFSGEKGQLDWLERMKKSLGVNETTTKTKGTGIFGAKSNNDAEDDTDKVKAPPKKEKGKLKEKEKEPSQSSDSDSGSDEDKSGSGSGEVEFDDDDDNKKDVKISMSSDDDEDEDSSE